MKLLLTGAAGRIGRALRPTLRERVDLLRVADISEVDPEDEREEALSFDLAEFERVLDAARGMDAVVHLGAIASEDAFERLLEANIRGTYNVFEAARLADVRRVVFASSNHATGFYRRGDRISPSIRPRPDSLYGVTKVFGEVLGSLYADKFGLEVVCLRIGSFAEAPPLGRSTLPMWLSPPDAVRLFWAALTAPQVRFEVVYGVSDTGQSWWDNQGAARIGYVAEDSVECARVAEANALHERQGDVFTDADRHGGARSREDTPG
jgi:uronate dehydrogenase